MSQNQTIFKNTTIDYNMQDDVYRANPAISQTELKTILVSPSHYRNYKDTPKEVTDEMTLGTAVHLASFQIEHFHNEVVQAPKFDKRTKDGKAGWEKFQLENQGKISLSTEDYETCIDISEVVRSHPIVAKYLSKGKPEVSLFADTQYENIKFKGRLDLVCEPCGIILDLKTIGKEASVYNCKNAIYDRGYDIQAFCYLELMKSMFPDRNFRFLFAFVEKKPPYGIRIVEINPVNLLDRYLTVNEAFKTLSECLTNNTWEGYPAKVNILDI